MTTAARHGLIDTRFGPVAAWLDARGALLRLLFNPTPEQLAAHACPRDDAALAEVARQLAEYQAGDRQTFDLPLAPQGTPFQQKVWAALREIPYGRTVSYGELALALGCPDGARAVGRANATNPIALIVPCHRVLGADGSLTGYAGGLPLKAALLRFELERSAPPGLFGG
ncbi:methylated-DNA--[protein]-cysteine S-methyltransferase [Chromobacterium violaceum]|uniref:Methylated-DNA--protein-cysteine methyltransferase n=1 Tax=Chromobacterium violaceum TaxID=536 RepID=A0AAX2MB44_CHRVL|nr:methylated-DNA--[protein]-cysteine S-methyltransferase [Chromobacterium violaceum]KMN48345.1 cysteine methyltransferase [Chromobacterium violaceum]KMN88424.1 cysteine methyltransferase [Chromobacterium violaceum]KMO02733.1 cysteine methyltransferase [Chromobacterium violaceum]OLZ78025.1 cysteine methyltransferase [Chromobacterium violaceum]STB64545.1 Methylated-DNA--protein-cysteine methyltransferase, constitutive [Chromobacterium violaceum]